MNPRLYAVRYEFEYPKNPDFFKDSDPLIILDTANASGRFLVLKHDNPVYMQMIGDEVTYKYLVNDQQTEGFKGLLYPCSTSGYCCIVEDKTTSVHGIHILVHIVSLLIIIWLISVILNGGI